jgi:hypothetical protein
MTSALPSFDDLLARSGPDGPAGSSWGLWGKDDIRGCLNLLTAERVLAGVGCVREGKVFSLNLELEMPAPPLFGRPALGHLVHDRATGHDDEVRFNTQSSSQWDGFRHVKHPIHGYYNGVADGDHGVHHWARMGVVGRAVLADVGRWREHEQRPIHHDEPEPIDAADVLATLEWQGARLEIGDILLIRTGWLSWYRALGADGRDALAAVRYPKHAGLRASVATVRMLWDAHVAAVAADNPGFEVMPPPIMDGRETDWQNVEAASESFLHTVLLPLLGLPIGELFDLDALAADCAVDRRYECLFTSAPLNVLAGVASPPNALALK